MDSRKIPPIPWKITSYDNDARPLLPILVKKETGKKLEKKPSIDGIRHKLGRFSGKKGR
jgi:hypothetical protein